MAYKKGLFLYYVFFAVQSEYEILFFAFEPINIFFLFFMFFWLTCTLAAVMASRPLRLNFSVVNYFRFVYHEEVIHISEAVYKNNIFCHSRRNHFKI